jgi:hypothetical protein
VDGEDEASQVPGEPPLPTCRNSSDPAASLPQTIQGWDVAYRSQKAVGSGNMIISGLNRSGRGLAVYASQRLLIISPSRKTRFQWWSAFPGGISTRRGSYERFPIAISPLPGLAWRNLRALRFQMGRG